MTLTELREKLQELESKGHGNDRVFFYQPTDFEDDIWEEIHIVEANSGCQSTSLLP